MVPPIANPLSVSKTRTVSIEPAAYPLSTSSSRERDRYDLQIRYRTLSIHVDDPKPAPNRPAQPAAAIRQIDIHTLPTDDVYTRFSTSPTLGLEAAAVARAAKYGKNLISPPKTQHWKRVLNYVFGGFNFLMWVAFIVTILSYRPLGDPNPAVFNLGVAILLLLVIIVSATFYAVVDFHASRIMKSIKSLIAEDATVIRDGEQKSIPASDIVVGDLVVLSMGDRVPADLRIVKASPDLRFDRSLLTGESDMIPGSTEPTSKNALETRNLALNSTFVVQGTCHGVTFAIGDRSIMGRIVAMSGESKFKLTTVQREVWFFTKIVSALALGLFTVSLVVWAAWLRRAFPGFETASGAIINSIGCLTAFVPQGLPVCVALSLTIIAKRMAARHVLVKNLATIETLGCMTVLCSDKTGTLTEGKMSVQSLAFIDAQFNLDESDDPYKELMDNTPELSISSGNAYAQLLLVSRICNGAWFDGGGASADTTLDGSTTPIPISERTVKGDPTDTAVLRFAEAGLMKRLGGNVEKSLFGSHQKIFEIPFNSGNKWMLSVINERSSSRSSSQVLNSNNVEDGTASSPDAETWMLVKGAPDRLFKMCNSMLRSDGTATAFDDEARSKINAIQAEWSSTGQRVLAVCKKSLEGVKVNPELMSANAIEEMLYDEMEDLTFIGLLGIRDPPRGDVEEAIKTIRRAGVRVVMVTGDFKLTAVSIAKQVGIITQEKIDDFTTLQGARKASTESLPRRPLPSLKLSEDDPIRSLVLTGDDVEEMDERHWDEVLASYTEIVFARTTPEQKLRIVEESKKRGDNIVAVTGDGVNDAPALKASDIGVAMGSGSDVAKEAAAMILLNNDFASIPVAIEMGRLVFDNLKKVMLYLMPAGTYTEFITVFCNVFLGMQLALSSYLQVCFSITNDVIMSISLMYEKPESDLMLRRPRNARTQRLTDWRFFFQIYLFIGLMMWPCAMSMWFLWMKENGLGFRDVILVYNKWTDGWQGKTSDELSHYVAVGQCIYYITIVFMQYGGLLAVRNRRVSILNSNPLWGPRQNLVVPAGMIGTALVGVVNLYGPGLQKVFGTTPIPGKFWGIPFAFALGILMVDEGRKALVRAFPRSFLAKMAW